MNVAEFTVALRDLARHEVVGSVLKRRAPQDGQLPEAIVGEPAGRQARRRRDLARFAPEHGARGVDQRDQAGLVAAVGGEALGDDDLVAGIDRELAVVALDEAVAGLDDALSGSVNLRCARAGGPPSAARAVGRGRSCPRTGRVRRRAAAARRAPRPRAPPGPRAGARGAPAVGDPARQLVATPIPAGRGIVRGVLALRPSQPALDLAGQRRLGRGHATKAHRLAATRWP
jgi:hypothetical protein